MDTHALERLDFPRVRELLAGFALSSLGRGLAGAIGPTARSALVHRWHQQVRELFRLRGQRGLPPFAGITDVRELIKRCAPPLQVSTEEIARIGDTLGGTHEVASYLANLPEDFPELRHLAGRIGDFGSIRERIRNVIDERSQVRDDASPKLARIRREIEHAAGRVREVVRRLLKDAGVRQILQFPNATFHQDRLVLPVKTEHRGRIPGIIHRHSDSGATIYVEPAEAVELNNESIKLRAEEAEEIARLLWELAHEVYLNADAILKTLDALAVLDLLAAKLRFADAFGMRSPELTEAAVLNVREARHPLLLELVRQRRERGEPADGVVPIHYRLGEDFDLLVITGPNTGGKTVALKTVGLLTLMVQAGLPVPAGEGSTFGVFRDVFVDIGDEQSLQQSLSTFSAHLKQQLETLRKAGPQSLVLIDEIGAGTDPEEGAAIGRAILEELLQLQCRCVVTTHIGALKSFAYTTARAENASVEFDQQTLRPTYHLRIGEPGSSNAIAIAQRLGMPRKLVHAAERNLSRQARMLHAAIAGTAAAKREAEAAREAAHSARLHADRAETEAAAARQSLERKQAEFQEWVTRVVHLRAGDPVRVRGFDRDGRIVRLRIDLQRAEVDVGSFTVEVPLGDVLPPQAPVPPPRPPRPPPSRPVAPVAVSAEGPAAHAAATPEAAVATRSAAGAETLAADTDVAGAKAVAVRAEGAAPGAPRPASADGGELRRGREHRPSAQPDRPPRPPRPPPPIRSLSDAQVNELKAGDAVYVKRLHRRGRLVRLVPEKKLAVVNVGLFEAEVPYHGLAQPPE